MSLTKHKIKGHNFKKLMSSVAVALAVGMTLGACSSEKLDLSTISTTALEKMDLRASVNASGKVESANSHKVFAEGRVSSNTIRIVNVKVGDTVKKGDILAELDTSALERQIQQQEAALSASEKQAGAGYRSAQRSYITAQEQYSEGRGSGVTSAQSSVNNASAGVDAAISGVDTAKSKVNSAKSGVDSAKSGVENARNAVSNAELGVENAKASLNTAQNNYNNALIMYELGEYSEDDLRKAEDAVIDAERGVANAENSLLDAQRAVTDAERSVEDAERSVIDAENAVVDAERGVGEAQQSLHDAQKALSDAYENAADQVGAARDSVDSAAASMDFGSTEVSIQQIKDQIADCVIKAPMDGTITLSNAEVGNTGTGVLFMVEHIDDLIIKTTVQQFDASSVSIGQRVIIKSDGLGDMEFEGEVKEIAPTAVKSATGDLVDGSGIEFETEIAVTDTKSGLLIGMSTQIYIITDEREDVFAVPFSALDTDEEGQNIIYVIEGEDKEMAYRAVPVEVGLETDYYVEIDSAELKEGMNVVNSPSDLFTFGSDAAEESPSAEDETSETSPDAEANDEADEITEEESSKEGSQAETQIEDIPEEDLLERDAPSEADSGADN